jgi:hypothetical protein
MRGLLATATCASLTLALFHGGAQQFYGAMPQRITTRLAPDPRSFAPAEVLDASIVVEASSPFDGRIEIDTGATREIPDGAHPWPLIALP